MSSSTHSTVTAAGISPDTDSTHQPRPQTRTLSAPNIFDRWLAARIQRIIDPARVRLELWDGSSPYQADTRSIGDLIVRDRRALIGLTVNPDLYFGESYMMGHLDVRGALPVITAELTRLSPIEPSLVQRI